MKQYAAISLRPERYANVLPFLAAVLAFAIAMQAKLLPFKPNGIEFPPTVENSPVIGVLPEYAETSGAAEVRGAVQTSVLPIEAVPDDQTPSSDLPSVAMAPGGTAGVGAAESHAPFVAAPMPLTMGGATGVGNIHIRTSRSSPLSRLAVDLMEQVKRIHPIPQQVRAKRPPTLKVEREIANPVRLAEATKERPATFGIGGPAALKSALGGASPLASKASPVINGTPSQKRF